MKNVFLELSLSIILPSYKNASSLQKNLPCLFKYLGSKNFHYEIIIVDDGSQDHGETEKVAKEYQCLFLKNEVNLGKGAAVRKGMLHAKGDYRIFTDADIPFELDAFERFLYYLDFKEFDIVVGDRTLPASSYFTEIPVMRKIGSSIFTFIVGRFITTGMFDTQCGMKGFSANAANDLFSVSAINGFAFDVELIYIALKRNYNIKRLPVRLRCHHQKDSSVNLLRHGTGMIVDLWKMRVNHFMNKYKKKNF